MVAEKQQIDTATVLFTDLVGSTALRARIGEEAADELRHTHDAIVTDAITTKRGTARSCSRRRADPLRGARLSPHPRARWL
jgi:class 3 adenylate cyclase